MNLLGRILATTLCVSTPWFSSSLLSAAVTEPPPLLAQALVHWEQGGREDLAFTQLTRVFHDDGRIKEERKERYDPSLPDQERWRLLTWNGRPATKEERAKWESKRNNRPRKKALKSPSEYLDVEKATLISEDEQKAQFELYFRPEIARLIAVNKVPVRVTIEKSSAAITRISGMLKEPMRIALGLARITDLDLDLRIETDGENPTTVPGDVEPGSSARVMLSKLGDPTEVIWSDFKRVKSYRKGNDS